jgi:hypothetical protein
VSAIVFVGIRIPRDWYLSTRGVCQTPPSWLHQPGGIIQNPITGLGFFSIFGITRRNRDWLGGFFSRRLGIDPKVISYPNNNSCFYYTNHGEIQETNESTYLKLGFLRSSYGERLIIDENNEQKLNPHDFQIGSISGNGYLIRIHRLEPRFTIFMTFMATSQVYYMLWEGGVFCSTDLRVLLRIKDEIKLNERAIPLHLIYRLAPGPMTHFEDVFRMFPGEIIAWHNGDLEIRRLRDMYCPGEKPEYDHLDSTVYEEYFQKLSGIMSSYVREIERRNGRIGNLLSGGVDSSVIQLLIAQHAAKNEAARSYSLRWEAPSFQFEVGYAKLASQLLNTEHTFLDMQNRNYADLLVRAIETLAQPNLYAEDDPGQLALAEHLAADYPGLHYVFTGMGSDLLHGIDYAKEVADWDGQRNLRGRYAFNEFWRLFRTPILRKRVGGLPDVLRYVFMPETYKCLRTPTGFLDPVARVIIPHTSLETLRHFLGDRVLVDSLEYRCSLSEKALTSHTLSERVHDIGTIAAAYNMATVFETLFSASREVLTSFYFDQDVIRLVRSVSPGVRYVQNNEVKPILKSILRQKSLGKIVHKKKGSSGFWRDFQSWMMDGFLREMVYSIERPGFISQKEFRRLIENRYPYGYDLVFPLLTYDIFKKHIARQYVPRNIA